MPHLVDRIERHAKVPEAPGVETTDEVVPSCAAPMRTPRS
jgi:hypothetical protein